MINFIFLFLFLRTILSEEEEEQLYESPCERKYDPIKPQDCFGRSTEFIEETCCFLESIELNDIDENNIFNQTVYECVDFAISDYERTEQKEIAIQKIKNGTYWVNFNEPYYDIITINCKSYFLIYKINFVLLLFAFLFF